MNIKLYIAMITTGLIGFSNVYASSASVPNTFVSGEAAVAAEVNENFTALETAINDNDSRITALEATPAPVTSYVSIPAHGMRPYTSGCSWLTQPGATFGEFDGATTTSYCEVVAAVNVLHGATLESLSCTVFDNDGDPSGLRASLRRVPVDGSTNTPSPIFSTNQSIDSVEVSTLTDNVASESLTLVDNQNYAYFLHMSFPNTTDTVGSLLQVFACSIGFSQ